MNFVNTNLTIYTFPSPENKKAAAPLRDCSFIIHKQYLFVTVQHPSFINSYIYFFLRATEQNANMSGLCLDCVYSNISPAAL